MALLFDPRRRAPHQMAVHTWRLDVPCMGYHTLAFWQTNFSKNTLPGTGILKSPTLLAFGNTFHAQYSLIFVLMTLASNILVMASMTSIYSLLT
jgi:hypothetical protein